MKKFNVHYKVLNIKDTGTMRVDNVPDDVAAREKAKATLDAVFGVGNYEIIDVEEL